MSDKEERPWFVTAEEFAGWSWTRRILFVVTYGAAIVAIVWAANTFIT